MSRALWILPLLIGCQQQMAEQPAYRPLQASPYFADGRASRPLPVGAVARGSLDDDVYAFRRFSEPATEALEAASLIGRLSGPSRLTPLGGTLSIHGHVAEFPSPVSLSTMQRGRERYTIFCAMCHGADGAGNGVIVDRGYTKPPSLVDGLSRRFERRGQTVALRELPAGYYVAVMSEGFGAMASYASQVRPADRWAIAAYIRALQASQPGSLDTLPDAERRAARSALEGPK